jgi:hypothetical protein
VADLRDDGAQAHSGCLPRASGSVRFYDSERSLARIVADFLVEGFETGSPAMVIATAGQREAIVRELTARSRDVAALQASGDLALLDGEQVLSTFMVDGRPDGQKFRDEIWRRAERLRSGRPDLTVRIFGQMVDQLWQAGNRDAAIRLELLWNQLARTAAGSVLCGYAIGNFYKDARLEDACGRRSHLVTANGRFV